jgi:hypothetical protein
MGIDLEKQHTVVIAIHQNGIEELKERALQISDIKYTKLIN